MSHPTRSRRTQPVNRSWSDPMAVSTCGSSALDNHQGDGAEHGGVLGVVEVRAAPGFSPPLHLHHREDEAFWLLKGAMTVCDGQTFKAGTGSFIWLPRGRPHTFRVDGDEPARMLKMITPGEHAAGGT